jgi:hypothetical protein
MDIYKIAADIEANKEDTSQHRERNLLLHQIVLCDPVYYQNTREGNSHPSEKCIYSKYRLVLSAYF